MTMQDPISDMLTRIRNAHSRHFADVSMPHSNLKMAIAGVLKEEGYIKDAQEETVDGKKQLQVTLKYYEGRPVIAQLDRASRPSLRQYKGKSDLPEVNNGLGLAIVTTSKGVMTAEKAKSLGLGGEVLCFVS